MNHLYLQITTDQFELPVAVADTVSELSLMTGAGTKHIRSSVSKAKRGAKTKFIKVVFDE